MDFQTAVENVKKLLVSRLETYNQEACQCAFPRYRQLMAIDCVDTSDAYSCYETELLMELSKPYFNWSDDNFHINAQWSCKKCGSLYSYEWQDFSISVNRQTLKIMNLEASEVGHPALKPIPLYLGLSGHSFPPKTEIVQASYTEFENYVLET